MAKAIVTEDLVAEVADALVVEGKDPSIVAIQTRIGGGSYSTVKRFRDIWIVKREADAAAVADVPSEVEAKGREFVQVVWKMAAQNAQRDVQVAKEEAAVEVAAVRGELNGAQDEIARLERLELQQSETIEQQAQRLRSVELELVEARAQASRLGEVQRELTAQKEALESARREVVEKSVEIGRLAGEAEALRRQVRDLTAALASKTPDPKG